MGRIEIFHFDSQPPKFITFSALHHQVEPIQHVDPDLPGVTADERPRVQARQDIRILEGDIDELSTKVEAYMKTMAVQYFESEPSTFIRESVTLSWELYQNTAVSNPIIPNLRPNLRDEMFVQNTKQYYSKTGPITSRGVRPLDCNSNPCGYGTTKMENIP